MSKREKSDFLPPKVPFVRQTVVPKPGVKRNYTLDPILFRGCVQSQDVAKSSDLINARGVYQM